MNEERVREWIKDHPGCSVRDVQRGPRAARGMTSEDIRKLMSPAATVATTPATTLSPAATATTPATTPATVAADMFAIPAAATIEPAKAAVTKPIKVVKVKARVSTPQINPDRRSFVKGGEQNRGQINSIFDMEELEWDNKDLWNEI